MNAGVWKGAVFLLQGWSLNCTYWAFSITSTENIWFSLIYCLVWKYQCYLASIRPKNVLWINSNVCFSLDFIILLYNGYPHLCFIQENHGNKDSFECVNVIGEFEKRRVVFIWASIDFCLRDGHPEGLSHRYPHFLSFHSLYSWL